MPAAVDALVAATPYFLPVAIGAACGLIAVCLWKERRSRPREADVWFAPGGHSLRTRLVGSLLALFDEEAGEGRKRHARTAVAQGKKAVAYRLMTSYLLELVHPQDAWHCLVGSKQQNYVKGPFYEGAELIFGREGLTVIRDDAYHTQQRRIVSPAFGTGSLRGMAEDVLADLVRRHVVDALRAAVACPAAGVDVGVIFDHAALAIIQRVAFAVGKAPISRDAAAASSDPSRPPSTDAATVSGISGHFRQIGALVMNHPIAIMPGPIGRILGFFPRRSIRQHRDAILETAANMVRSCRGATDAADTLGSDRKTLAEYLVDTPHLTPEAIAGHGLNFLLAGHETTATTLSWACHLLAKHANIQADLYDELFTLIAPHFAVASNPDALSQDAAPLLNDVISETLRLYPPCLVLIRQAVRDDVLPSGLVLRAGTQVQIPCYSIHHSNAVWGPDADAFRPSRWRDLRQAGRTPPPGAYSPFSLGKRNCIGKDMALLELRCILASVVRHFALSLPTPSREPRRRLGITMRMEEGIRLCVTVRAS